MSGIERTVRTRWSRDFIVTGVLILEGWERWMEVGSVEVWSDVIRDSLGYLLPDPV